MALSLELRDDVGVLRIDVPDSKYNVLGAALLDELGSMLDRIERERLAGVVIASGKAGSFIAGADLREIGAIGDPEEASALSRRAHALLDRIAGGAIPFVAAIDGLAMGGGLEIALACRHRVATDAPETVLALPEVTLGLIPAAGGTQRLPRVIGLTASLPMLLAGARVRARRALAMGLVDAVVPREALLETAIDFARRPRPARRRRDPASLPLVRSFVLRKARADVARRTRNHYPAPYAILDAVATGFARGAAAGARKEIEAFGVLVVSPEAKSLLRLLDLSTAARKGPRDAPPVARLGLVGAGLMGGGIASIALDAQPVVLIDRDPAALANAKAMIGRALARRVETGSLSADDAREREGRLETSTDLAALAGCDLVIEAVFEDLDLKRRLFREIETIVGDDAVIATNTSAIPVASIREGMRRPGRVVGMHFFSPAVKMPLLEIVEPPGLAPGVLDRVRTYGATLGKSMIVVADAPGFYTTRILAPYLDEAMRVFEEGAGARRIDEAMRDFGFPIGPMALLDEVGLDVGAHVSEDLGRAFAGRRRAPSDTLRRMVASGMLGRKSGRGFYIYGGKRKKPNREAERIAGSSKGGPPPDEIARRLVRAMVEEARRALAEGVVRSEDDGDLGAVLGLGFPPFRGGPFQWGRRMVDSGPSASARGDSPDEV